MLKRLYLGGMILLAGMLLSVAWPNQVSSQSASDSNGFDLELNNEDLLAAEMKIADTLETSEKRSKEDLASESDPAELAEYQSDTDLAFRNIKNSIGKPLTPQTTFKSAPQGSNPKASLKADSKKMSNDIADSDDPFLMAPAPKQPQKVKPAPAPPVKKAQKKDPRITSLQADKHKLTSKLKSSDKRTKALLAELKQTRNKLLIAETEIERLSHMIEARNIGINNKYSGKNSSVSGTNSNTKNYYPPTAKKSSKPSKTDMPIATVIVSKANLRTGPGKNNSPIMTVSKGTRLVVETRIKDWYRILAPNGTRAWISGKVVAFGKNGNSSPTRIYKGKSYDTSIN